ncbi:MAG: hypothetical protein U0169_02785 [Polyangiaceae bacterium]
MGTRTRTIMIMTTGIGMVREKPGTGTGGFSNGERVLGGSCSWMLRAGLPET